MTADGADPYAPSIYVAASSGEVARARRAMAAVRARAWTVVHDWTETIAGVGEANPIDAPHADRLAWSRQAFDAIDRAWAVWLCTPSIGAGRGAFAELGYAIAIGRLVVASGKDRRASIFTACAIEVADDADAPDLLAGLFAQREREGLLLHSRSRWTAAQIGRNTSA